MASETNISTLGLMVSSEPGRKPVRVVAQQDPLHGSPTFVARLYLPVVMLLWMLVRLPKESTSIRNPDTQIISAFLDLVGGGGVLVLVLVLKWIPAV